MGILFQERTGRGFAWNQQTETDEYPVTDFRCNVYSLNYSSIVYIVLFCLN